MVTKQRCRRARVQFFDSIKKAGRDTLTTCDEVICDRPWDAFVSGLSPNFRSNLTKARHKIEHAGGASYQFVNDPAGVDALFPEFLRVEASGWKGLAERQARP